MKKGFTLLEIIVVILLITVIGTTSTVVIIKNNNKKEKNVLVENEDNFKKALEVYLSKHNEIINNINNNVEGAIVSLELLKNEGLINSNLKIDYENNYYVVTNAFLSNEGVEQNIVKETCDNSIGLETIASWAKSNNTKDVLYFCHKGDVEDDEIEDPYEDCNLVDERLYCKVIKNAINEKKRQEDIGTYEFNSTLKETGSGDKINFTDELSVYRENPLTAIGELPAILAETDHNEIYDIILSYNGAKGSETEYPGLETNNSYYRFADNYIIKNIGDNRFITLDDSIEWSNKKFIELTYDVLYGLIGKYVQFRNHLGKGSGISPVFKILELKDLGIKSGTKHIQITYKIINSKYENEKKIEKTLSKTEDNYGYSYYFRGDTKDNYVNFNNMCWRLVRIQGDGSIKLILESSKGTCSEVNLSFGNELIGNDWYGYIGAIETSSANLVINYDHSTGGRGIKPTLINWLESNFDDNDFILMKKQNYCFGNVYVNRDLEFSNNWLTYKEISSLKCEDTDNVYTLEDYISILNVDEIYYGGATNESYSKISQTYLIKNSYWCSITIDNGPVFNNYCRNNSTLTTTTGVTPGYVFTTNYSGVNKVNLYANSTAYFPIFGVRPVVVLKSEVKYSSGNGTLSNPYEIKLSLD